MNILAIIPARGGSKGIPKKNIRLMNGKPLIYYSIKNASNSKYITDVIVSTDDQEIKNISKMCGAEVLDRPIELAKDKTTLDPVIYHATETIERNKNIKYDAIITLQPTSPLLTSETLDKAIENFKDTDCDCIISAINAPHLSWTKINGKYIPNYKERLNRQLLPPNYLETGAFFISKRNIITPNSRIGGKISLFEVPENESIDIDKVSDWIVCESQLNRKNIVLRCDGNREIGMGHVYHCISLGHNLIEHNVTIITNVNNREGYEKLLSSNLKVVGINNEREFFDYLEKNKTDIVVNDCLDTTIGYIKKLKKLVNRVVSIEDMGDGAKEADAVINALYKDSNSIDSNIYSGPQYVCLREEFALSKPAPFNDNIKNILVLFGGTDPSNLTEKIFAICKKDKYNDINFNFIIGIGSSFNVENNKKNIKLYKDVKNVSLFMSKADLAFTSQGRTVYELASSGVPSIVLAQNDRELLHTFAYMENGFLNLGLGSNVNINTIEHTLDWLICTPSIRKQMKELMLKTNLRDGTKNEIKVILGI